MTDSKLAILIPTYGRPEKVEKLIENIEKTTKTPHRIYVIAEGKDKPTIDLVTELSATLPVVLIKNKAPYTYVSAINWGYYCSTEPFVYCAADDVWFTKHWDVPVMDLLEQGYGFVGTKDDWVISKTQKHASHFAVSRKYIDEQGGVLDHKGVIYHPGYYHYQCDIETEQTAMVRNQFILAPSTVQHIHWMNSKREKDPTDTKENSHYTADLDLYKARRTSLNFEVYLYEGLVAGKVIPILPELKNAKRPLLSIIIASYNATKILNQTIDSLLANTYYPFELIFVDDNSSDPTTWQYIKNCNPAGIPVKRLQHKKQTFTDGVWNDGVAMATGDYIAILNNDILLSQNWDLHLIAALQTPDAWMANPYQTDDGFKEGGKLVPYGMHERAGGIDIRGTCYMMKREATDAIFPLPYQLVHWFGDYWIAEAIHKAHMKSVWVKDVVIHHFGSVSTILEEAEHKMIWWVIRGDCYAFSKLTGINTDYWVKVIESRLGIQK